MTGLAESNPSSRLEADREELTLREQLVRALNGVPIHRESAVEILQRWDAVERFVKEITR
jgi:hypothetical protein